MSDIIHIFQADDHSIVREGMRALIMGEPDIAYVGEAGDGVTAVERILELQPDVILLDLQMPIKSGLEIIPEIKQHIPNARILVITSFGDDEYVFPAIKAGALGYLLKDTSPDEILHAIREVYAGRSSLHPSIAKRVLQ